MRAAPHTHQANKYLANHNVTMYNHMLLFQYLFYQITQKGSYMYNKRVHSQKIGGLPNECNV